MTRTARIQIRPDVHATLRRLARAHGCPMGALVESLIREAARERKPPVLPLDVRQAALPLGRRA